MNLLIVAVSAGLIITSGCEKIDDATKKDPVLPTVTTAEVTNIAQTTATCGGNVTSDGNAETTRGICWSPSPEPDLTGPHTVDGTGKGEFVSQITGLAPTVKYYVRAYATNSVGTVYGNQREFTTPI